MPRTGIKHEDQFVGIFTNLLKLDALVETKALDKPSPNN